jgi:4-hydroxyphenylpyruvate dioxygenase-like putative hemolysin
MSATSATTPTKLHHVVFCVHPENLERATNFWRDLGLEFEEIVLPELSLRVLLSWHAGIELISPTGDHPAAAAFTSFLAEKGEGVYSIAVSVPKHAAAVEIAQRYGVETLYHQVRNGEHDLEESMLAPLHGMPVTFLTTDRPL